MSRRLLLVILALVLACGVAAAWLALDPADSRAGGGRFGDSAKAATGRLPGLAPREEAAGTAAPNSPSTGMGTTGPVRPQPGPAAPEPEIIRPDPRQLPPPEATVKPPAPPAPEAKPPANPPAPPVAPNANPHAPQPTALDAERERRLAAQRA
ncbi:MAG: hypothetical protein KJ044_17085, partial [Planctomycetes bacterium]|nr:hypothetical protein [Planctomycetota bacterium]